MAKKDSEVEKDQHTAFRRMARELECDESEARFDQALGKIGSHKAAPAQPRKRKLTPRGKV